MYVYINKWKILFLNDCLVQKVSFCDDIYKINIVIAEVYMIQVRR
jgi:hypothetical protein